MCHVSCAWFNLYANLSPVPFPVLRLYQFRKKCIHECLVYVRPSILCAHLVKSSVPSFYVLIYGTHGKVLTGLHTVAHGTNSDKLDDVPLICSSLFRDNRTYNTCIRQSSYVPVPTPSIHQTVNTPRSPSVTIPLNTIKTGISLYILGRF